MNAREITRWQFHVQVENEAASSKSGAGFARLKMGEYKLFGVIETATRHRDDYARNET